MDDTEVQDDEEPSMVSEEEDAETVCTSMTGLGSASADFDAKSSPEERRRSSIKLEALAFLATELLTVDSDIGGTPKTFVVPQEDEMSTMSGRSSTASLVSTPEVAAPLPVVTLPPQPSSAAPLKKRKPRAGSIQTRTQEMSSKETFRKINASSPSFNETLLNSLHLQPRAGILTEYFSEQDSLWSTGGKKVVSWYK